MRVEFLIGVRLPGMNDIIGAANRHRMAGAELKRRWTKTCAEYAVAACLPKLAEAVRVEIDWFENDMRRDRDNIIGGTKFILDGLVLAGTLPNDTARWVKEIIHRFPAPERGRARVWVTLQTMGGPNDGTGATDEGTAAETRGGDVLPEERPPGSRKKGFKGTREKR